MSRCLETSTFFYVGIEAQTKVLFQLNLYSNYLCIGHYRDL